MLKLYHHDLTDLIHKYEKSDEPFTTFIKSLIFLCDTDIPLPEKKILNIINHFFAYHYKEQTINFLLFELFNKLGFIYKDFQVMISLINIFRILNRNKLINLQNYSEINNFSFDPFNIYAVEKLLIYSDNHNLLTDNSFHAIMKINPIKLASALQSFPKSISQGDFNTFLSSNKLSLLIEIFTCLASLNIEVTQTNFHQLIHYGNADILNRLGGVLLDFTSYRKSTMQNKVHAQSQAVEVINNITTNKFKCVGLFKEKLSLKCSALSDVVPYQP